MRKNMNIREFRETGWIHEINRHPSRRSTVSRRRSVSAPTSSRSPSGAS